MSYTPGHTNTSGWKPRFITALLKGPNSCQMISEHPPASISTNCNPLPQGSNPSEWLGPTVLSWDNFVLQGSWGWKIQIGSRYEGGRASQVVLVVKNPPASAGDLRVVGSILGSGRSPGGELDHPLQYFCLENPTDRGAWWATVHRIAKSWNNWNDLAYTHTHKGRSCQQEGAPWPWHVMGDPRLLLSPLLTPVLADFLGVLSLPQKQFRPLRDQRGALQGKLPTRENALFFPERSPETRPSRSLWVSKVVSGKSWLESRHALRVSLWGFLKSSLLSLRSLSVNTGPQQRSGQSH